MTPLQLSGTAKSVAGIVAPGRRLVRLNEIANLPSGPVRDADAAIVRNGRDLATARDQGFTIAVIFDGSMASETADLGLAVHLDERFGYLADGDVIALDTGSRRFRVLYRRASKHNSLLVTERCNHYCLMCSQPPRNIDDGWIIDEISDCIELIDPKTKAIGFTGGEPLLEWRRFLPILTKMRDLLPQTAVHVLTNGRAFTKDAVATAWANVRHSNLSAGIPIYAAVDHIHDYVVQAPGAFDETVLGILKLKDKGQRVEIRVVLHAVTTPRLKQTCEWLARNLPFVDHVALMGLENTGFALANQETLWIDPLDYADDLAGGVGTLKAAGVNVSVYNLPLCLLDRLVWDVAAQSISDWKNAYLPVCDQCGVRSRCSGFFSTGRMRTSRGIRPVDPFLICSAPDHPSAMRP
jgi:His-Xaa-Ser system radical SAM maturase HxsC